MAAALLISANAAPSPSFSSNSAKRSAATQRGFVAGLSTDWRSDPFSRGAWSWARPGASHRRSALAESLDGRLHFAAKLCAPTLFATCHGALLSGERTARQILARMKR